jgi:hypothetical protein
MAAARIAGPTPQHQTEKKMAALESKNGYCVPNRGVSAWRIQSAPADANSAMT